MVSHGHIYKGTYSGWYCISDEAFLVTDDVKDITTSDEQIIKVRLYTHRIGGNHEW